MTASALAVVQGVTQDVTATPADDTAQTITLVIGGLVGLAVVLALLTIWYWRRTDPRRAARRAGAPVAVEGTAASTHPRPQHRDTPAAAPASPAPPEPEGGISADEWLRLTGPSNPPRDGEP